jgi:hypothetical protein
MPTLNTEKGIMRMTYMYHRGTGRMVEVNE